MTISRMFALSVLMAMPAVAAAQSAPPEVVKVRDGYVKAVHAGDPKALALLFAEDAGEMPPHDTMKKGRAAIEEYNAGFLNSNAVKLTLTPIESMTAGDLAYDVGAYSQTITPKQPGATPMTDRGKYTVILRRGADGQWRVKWAIYNSDLPPMPAPPTAKPAAK